MNNRKLKIVVGLFLLICLRDVTGKAQILADSRSSSLLRVVPSAMGQPQKMLKDHLNELSRRFKVSILFEESVVYGITVNPNALHPLNGKPDEYLDQVLKPSGLTYKKIGHSQYVVFPTALNSPETKKRNKFLSETGSSSFLSPKNELQIFTHCFQVNPSIICFNRSEGHGYFCVRTSF